MKLHIPYDVCSCGRNVAKRGEKFCLTCRRQGRRGLREREDYVPTVYSNHCWSPELGKGFLNTERASR